MSDDGGAQAFRLPRQTGLTGRELQLYELIFQRTLASVMIDAELDLTTAHIRYQAIHMRLVRAGLCNFSDVFMCFYFA